MSKGFCLRTPRPATEPRNGPTRKNPRKIPKKYPPARNSGLPEFTPKIPRKYRKKDPQNTKNAHFWYFLCARHFLSRKGFCRNPSTLKHRVAIVGPDKPRKPCPPSNEPLKHTLSGPSLTILKVDLRKAFDTIHQSTILQGLLDTPMNPILTFNLARELIGNRISPH